MSWIIGREIIVECETRHKHLVSFIPVVHIKEGFKITSDCIWRLILSSQGKVDPKGVEN